MGYPPRWNHPRLDVRAPRLLYLFAVLTDFRVWWHTRLKLAGKKVPQVHQDTPEHSIDVDPHTKGDDVVEKMEEK